VRPAESIGIVEDSPTAITIPKVINAKAIAIGTVGSLASFSMTMTVGEAGGACPGLAIFPATKDVGDPSDPGILSVGFIFICVNL
jgi:hypothetical protein